MDILKNNNFNIKEIKKVQTTEEYFIMMNIIYTNIKYIFYTIDKKCIKNYFEILNISNLYSEDIYFILFNEYDYFYGNEKCFYNHLYFKKNIIEKNTDNCNVCYFTQTNINEYLYGKNKEYRQFILCDECFNSLCINCFDKLENKNCPFCRKPFL